MRPRCGRCWTGPRGSPRSSPPLPPSALPFFRSTTQAPSTCCTAPLRSPVTSRCPPFRSWRLPNWPAVDTNGRRNCRGSAARPRPSHLPPPFSARPRTVPAHRRHRWRHVDRRDVGLAPQRDDTAARGFHHRRVTSDAWLFLTCGHGNLRRLLGYPVTEEARDQRRCRRDHAGRASRSPRSPGAVARRRAHSNDASEGARRRRGPGVRHRALGPGWSGGSSRSSRFSGGRVMDLLA